MGEFWVQRCQYDSAQGNTRGLTNLEPLFFLLLDIWALRAFNMAGGIALEGDRCQDVGFGALVGKRKKLLGSGVDDWILAACMI